MSAIDHPAYVEALGGARPAARPKGHGHAGRVERGELWASLHDVAGLLRVRALLPPQAGRMLFRHRHLKLGQRLFTAGARCDALYAVNAGFLKLVLPDGVAAERVLSFPMKGDLLGVDGLADGQHRCEAVALSECDVIALDRATGHAGDVGPAFEALILAGVSRTAGRDYPVLALSGSSAADARLARFLTMLSDRMAALGFSGHRIRLHMTRHEIGSYLGLSLETVSRAFTALSAAGLVRVDHREVEIPSVEALRAASRPHGHPH